MGPAQGGHAGLILVPLNSACADCFDTWLIFPMTDGSPLNGAPAWGCKGFLNRAIRGLHGACMGQSYGADFGAIELSLLC